MKILILTASPIRDKQIDNLIAQELTRRGHEVQVRPCLREGRKAVLEFQPDVVVTPPIRNPYSRDFVDTMKHYGIGVVSRHTEASCDWQDFQKMGENERMDILGKFKYAVDKELVWGEDEAQLLRRRNCPFPVIPVGAFGLDIYKQDISGFGTKEDFKKKFGFTKDNILLIACPWGFADSAPDLNIDETVNARKDAEGRKRHIDMIKHLKTALPDWDILVTLHPGVLPEEYKAQLPDTPIDLTRSSTELLYHCDALVHSGSTMGMEMHFLNKPAYQFQDVNEKLTAGWWLKTGTPLSQVSPEAKTPEDLAAAILAGERTSNANLDAVAALENGRYGKMDGLAYQRAADEIESVKGKFELRWPKATIDYDQPLCVKDGSQLTATGTCGICGGTYTLVRKEWMVKILSLFKIPQTEADKMYNVCCPNCASRFYLPWQQ